MSLLKSKTFLRGVLLVILVAAANTAMAFTPTDGRLWKPYQPETFGGNRRNADGFYASVEGILWKVDGPKSIPVGYRNPDGSVATRAVYTNGQTNFNHRSSMNTNSIDTDFSLGTRVELGNVRGHHGWLFSGYGFDNSGSYEQRNGSMVIRDPENLSVYCIFYGDGVFNKIWQPDGSFVSVPVDPSYDQYEMMSKKKVDGVGYLWGWHPVEWDDWMEGYLAPLPINFDRAQIKNEATIVNLELMYTYRPHPFKWGEMEIIAGARYWGFDDKFSFLGLGYKEAYDEFEDLYLNSGNNNNNNSSGSGGSSGSNNNNNGNTTDNRDVLGEVNSNILGPLSVLADTTIVGKVNNRITGPQIGVKFSRRNTRWTFGAEGRFMAGINSQSQVVYGTLGTHFVDTSKVPTIGGGFIDGGSGGSSGSGSSNTVNTSLVNSGIMPYMPIGFTRDTQSFHHRRHKTVFSPGFELRLNAQWQWTDAVGLQVGFNSTIFDNIIRGADIIDYAIQDDGELFGIRNAKKTAVITYGFNFGINIKR